MAVCAVPLRAPVLRVLAGRDRGPTVASTRALTTRGSSGVRVGGGRSAAASRDAPPPSPTRRERRDAHRDARHAKLAGVDGGSRVTRAAATLGSSRETVRLAGGVDATVDRAVELASGRDETTLEVALGLATDATRVAREDARYAARDLRDRIECAEALADGAAPGGTRADAFAGIGDLGEPSEPLEPLERLERASRDASLVSARANDVRLNIQRRLRRRLIEDEWRSIIASVASVDFRRDRKRPRVRARDRRCNQPKARQGWDKKTMRAARVRVCAGCDRMLPAAELIRIVRVARRPNEAGDDETRDGNEKDFERGDDGAEKVEKGDGSSDASSRETKKVVVLDVSSFLPGAGAEALAASVAPGGPFAAATGDHPAAARAAAALAAGASGRAADDDDAPRARVARLPGRAAYVCRRGHCARAVAKARTLKRHLRVSPGGADASSARRFHDALVGACDEAEALDGVDSSGWAFAREPGTPSRWEAHPVCVDRSTGREVASERAKRLAVGGSGPDEDAAAASASASAR